jgi:hypothetical protein
VYVPVFECRGVVVAKIKLSCEPAYADCGNHLNCESIHKWCENDIVVCAPLGSLSSVRPVYVVLTAEYTYVFATIACLGEIVC